VTFGDTRDEQGLQTFIPYRIEEFFSDEGPNMRFIHGADYYPYKKVLAQLNFVNNFASF
jgi:hypothetical protein